MLKLMHLFLSLLDRLPGISGLASFPLSFKPFKYCSTDWVKFLKFLIYLSQLCQCTNEVILDLLEEPIPVKKATCVWYQAFALQLSSRIDW